MTSDYGVNPDILQGFGDGEFATQEDKSIGLFALETVLRQPSNDPESARRRNITVGFLREQEEILAITHDPLSTSEQIKDAWDRFAALSSERPEAAELARNARAQAGRIRFARTAMKNS